MAEGAAKSLDLSRVPNGYRGDVEELVHGLGGWFEVLLLPKLGWSVRNESCHIMS